MSRPAARPMGRPARGPPSRSSWRLVESEQEILCRAKGEIIFFPPSLGLHLKQQTFSGYKEPVCRDYILRFTLSSVISNIRTHAHGGCLMPIEWGGDGWREGGLTVKRGGVGSSSVGVTPRGVCYQLWPRLPWQVNRQRRPPRPPVCPVVCPPYRSSVRPTVRSSAHRPGASWRLGSWWITLPSPFNESPRYASVSRRRRRQGVENFQRVSISLLPLVISLN